VDSNVAELESRGGLVAAVAARPRWRENRPATGAFAWFDGAELWSHRDLALLLALKDLKVRYKQTLLGVAWVVLQPVAGAAIFTLVFGRFDALSGGDYPYALVVYTGLIIWLYISGSVGAAARSLVEQRELLTKVYFPRVLAPTAAVVPPLVDLAVSLAVAAVFMAVYGAEPSFALVLLPVWVGFALLLALGVGSWLAALNVKYRDVRHALGFFLQMWLFASPVVYSSETVAEQWQTLYALNPAVGIIDGFRWSLASGPAPGPEVLISFATTVLTLVLGLVYFQRAERSFADLI
jgi:lipopolysaccharide transport system permease protein